MDGILRRRAYWAILCLGFFTLWAPSLVYAAAQYEVAPLIIEHELEPRDIIQDTVVVRNTGDTSVTVFGSVNAVQLGVDGGLEEFVTPVDADRSTSITSWIEFNRSRIHIPKGESVEVPITIRVNLNAEPGTYHARLGFAHGKNTTIAAERAKSLSVPGVMITIRIGENRSELLRLGQFLVDKVITKDGGENVRYTVKNPGETDLAPTGDIIFYNNRGNEVTTIPVNPDGETIAPGEAKTFTTSVPTEGLIGKYKAFLTVEFGNAQLASVQDTTFFYVLPWRQLLIYFLILFAIVLGIALYVHKRSEGKAALVDPDADDVPFQVRETREGKEYHHDINLKQ